MSQSETSNHVEELLDQSHKHISEGRFEDAAHVLRTTSSLAPNDERVQAAWNRLKSSESKPDLVSLCKNFNHYEDPSNADLIINASKSGQFSEHDVSASLALLLGNKDANSLDIRDTVVAALCNSNNGSRALASFLKERPTETFRDIWKLGAKSIDCMINTLINKSVWNSPDERTAAVIDAFILLLAKLLDINLETPVIAVRCLAKLMATDAPSLQSSIDDENFAIILSFIDVERTIEVRSQATLIVAKFIEISTERAQAMLKDYVVTRFSKKTQSNDDIVAAVSVAGAIFPVVPAFAANLFLTDGFSKELLRILSKTRSTRLRVAGLELLSASCIDKDCREKIRQDCVPWLYDVVRAKNGDWEVAMAGLVLSKVRPGASGDVVAATSGNKNINADSVNELIPIFTELSMHTSEPEMQTSVEALAYNSMDSSVKELLANDSQFLINLIKQLLEPSNKGPMLFGGLTILSNLTSYPPILSAEGKRMAQLRAYANQTKMTECSELDNEAHVTDRCKRILDVGAVPMLVKATKQASYVILNLVSNIFLSLSKQKAHCGTMVQQGALDCVLQLAQLDLKDGGQVLSQIKKQSAQAMARLLIPIDPNLLFANKEQHVQTCIGPLKYLLSLVDDPDPLVPFDALRALTNVASYSDGSARLIVDACTAEIIGHLDSTRSAIQQAATECICNLTQSTYAAFKLLVVPINEKPYDPFPSDFDIGNENADRRSITFLRMLWFSTEKARGTRLAAMAALSSVTSFEDGLNMLLRAPRGLEHVFGALEDAQSVESGEKLGLKGKAANAGDADMRMRALTVLMNVAYLSMDERVLQKMKQLNITSLIGAGTENLPSDRDSKQQIIELSTQILRGLETKR